MATPRNGGGGSGSVYSSDQVRANRVSLISLDPEHAPSTRSPSPARGAEASASAGPSARTGFPRTLTASSSSRSQPQQPVHHRDYGAQPPEFAGPNQQRFYLDGDDADLLALEPPTLDTYRTSLRNHILALLPALGLIAILAWVSSTYADLSPHHHRPAASPDLHHPARKPPLLLAPLGAAAWLAAYAVRPLLWDLTDNALWLLLAPFSAAVHWIQRRRERRRHGGNRYARGRWFGGRGAQWEYDEGVDEQGLGEPAHGPWRVFCTLALSILLRIVVLELLRIGSMVLAIAALDAATSQGHFWLSQSEDGPRRASLGLESLLLSPYDNRFGAVLWTTVGWCSAEWLIGSYDVLRKLRLYHPSLWPSAMYSDSVYGDDDYADADFAGHPNNGGNGAYRDGDVDDYDDEDEHGANIDIDIDIDIDREAGFPRTRTRASAPAANAGASGIEAATSAAQAAVHAVRFFPRVFTHQSAKSSSSSAFTIRPGPVTVGGGGDGNGSAFVLPTHSGGAGVGAGPGAGGHSSGFHQLGGTSGAGVRRRAATQSQMQFAGAGTGAGRGQAGAGPSSSSRKTLASEEEASTLLPSQTSHHTQFSTALDSSTSGGGAYGTFQTARSFQRPSSAFAQGADGEEGEEGDEEDDGSRTESGQSQHRSDDDDAGERERDAHGDEARGSEPARAKGKEPAFARAPTLDPEEEDALQARLAHALAILLAARERADLEETLGARLDVQVGPALAALWRIDGFVWNLGECLLVAAAVAITSEVYLDGDGSSDAAAGVSREGRRAGWWYETVPDLGASPLLPTWLVLTALHTVLSLLWATALPKLGFAPVSYSSLLLGMGLSVAGLAWWGVLI